VYVAENARGDSVPNGTGPTRGPSIVCLSPADPPAAEPAGPLGRVLRLPSRRLGSAIRLAGSEPTAPRPGVRPQVAGKFLQVGDDKLWVRGVSYGTFRPDHHGNNYGPRERVERDFAEIALGFNAIRTYTVPPRWLLDAALRHGLWVAVGLPWEQHVVFLDDRQRARSIEARVREGVVACAGHPAVLWYTVGNEIPSSIVRWHGRRRVERFVERLCSAAKAADPAALVTYVNYPTTEYLDLPFLDLVTFNVYLERRDLLEAYLARLHNLAGDRPLVMAEVGLDSRRHGEELQAHVIDWQVRATFSSGCAGLFVFSWTDEWHRGGYEIEDWDFGLTRRDRRPKPALVRVRDALGEVPVAEDGEWPRISVVVCTYNGASTIRGCLEGLRRLQYPNLEVIVVNDGSRDATPAIVREYGVRMITTENRGLSSARNTGWRAASGELVAYLDDDAWPDPHWLHYLAEAFRTTAHVAVGGPNVPPPDETPIARCVANAPGGPVHVLLSDREAEHLPGCNMAVRRWALEAIGGFDPQFRTAGDDVDVCWRLQARGWTLGFHPAALVWHRRRASIRGYWRQQQGYGKAETLLQRKWPQKYNDSGQIAWHGRLYGLSLARGLGWRRGRIYQGTWGSAGYQSLYAPASGRLASWLLLPEWYLFLLTLVLVSALGALWAPLALAAPLFALAAAATVAQALVGARRARFPLDAASRLRRLRLRAITALLHLVQPVARLTGRLGHGLTPWWRRAVPSGRVMPWPRQAAIWRESWEAPEATLESLEQRLTAAGATVRRGGDFDGWDLEVKVGALGAGRLLLTIEEHGAGRQYVRFRAWPRPAPAWLATALGAGTLATLAEVDGAWAAAGLLGAAAVVTAVRTALDCGASLAAMRQAFSPAATTQRSGRAAPPASSRAA
jgi:O-antigen biosynthesis protein